MSTNPLPPGTATLPPWVDKERNGCLQTLIVGGFVLLILTGLGALVGVITFLSDTSLFSEGTGIWGFVTALLMLGGSVVGLIFLFPQLKVPASFNSHYAGASNVLGVPFEIRFRSGYNSGTAGTIWFGDATIQVTGKGDVSCLLWLFIGWFALFFRQDYTRNLPYSSVNLVSVTGRTVSFVSPIPPLQRFTFRVSLQDGERLYRELCYHYPAQMQQYAYLFTDSPSVKPTPAAPLGVPQQ